MRAIDISVLMAALGTVAMPNDSPIIVKEWATLHHSEKGEQILGAEQVTVLQFSADGRLLTSGSLGPQRSGICRSPSRKPNRAAQGSLPPGVRNPSPTPRMRNSLQPLDRSLSATRTVKGIKMA